MLKYIQTNNCEDAADITAISDFEFILNCPKCCFFNNKFRLSLLGCVRWKDRKACTERVQNKIKFGFLYFLFFKK